MILNDEYRTISNKKSEGFYSAKRSKFLAFAYHVENIEQAKEIIADHKTKYYDARHCCYAYAIGAKREIYRQNDDGEPSSTAGKPIMGQILSHDLTDVLIIVVRYYGGVNLGTSGLIEAYKTAAANALENAEIQLKHVESIQSYSFAYNQMNSVMNLIKEYNPRIIQRDFSEKCSITIAIRQSQEEIFTERIKKILIK